MSVVICLLSFVVSPAVFTESGTARVRLGSYLFRRGGTRQLAIATPANQVGRPWHRFL